MVRNPPDRTPACCPYLFYDDVEAALRFLVNAFGFEKRVAVPGPEGRIEHAQAALGEALIMMGPTKSPRELRPARSPKEAGSLNASVYLYVADVDAHYQRASASGAEILAPPADMFWGDRLYCALDPEGQFWCFATHVRDVAM